MTVAIAERVNKLMNIMSALDPWVARLTVPADRPRPVVLPSYGGAVEVPNLTALLALLLQRYGVPVLLHGPADATRLCGRVATVSVLRELGIDPAGSVAEEQRRIESDRIAYVPTDVVVASSGEPKLRDSRRAPWDGMRAWTRLIDPFGGVGLRAIAVPGSSCLEAMRAYLAATRADAVLLHETEGEPFANPYWPPQLECFREGVGTVLFDATGVPAIQPVLPAAIDAATTAAWVSAALAGEQPIPQPILNELACCLHAIRGGCATSGR